VGIRKKIKKRYHKDSIKGLFFILPSLAGVSVFVMIPFIDVIRRSFVASIKENFVGFANYADVFSNTAFQLAGKNTLRFVGICIPLLIVLSLMIGVFLHRQGKFGNALKTVYLFPMAIPVASIVLLWRLLFHSQGFLNGILDKFGITAMDWMNSKYAFWVLVFSYLWKNMGYNIVLWLAGLSSISENIYEAARVDGAGEWKIFWKITLPNLVPTLYTITVLSFLNSFKVFREAYLVGGDYPHTSMYLLQHLFNNWFRELSFDKMAAAAVVVAGIIFILITLLQKAWASEE